MRTPVDALERPAGAAAADAPSPRRIRTRDALERILFEDLASPSDLPTFRRSTMDGFAVRAADTFGATEGLPAYLELVDEVFMGQPPTV